MKKKIPCRCGQKGAQCMIHNPPFEFIKKKIPLATAIWSNVYDSFEEYQRGRNDMRIEIMKIIDTYLNGKIMCMCDDCTKVREDIKRSINLQVNENHIQKTNL